MQRLIVAVLGVSVWIVFVLAGGDDRSSALAIMAGLLPAAIYAYVVDRHRNAVESTEGPTRDRWWLGMSLLVVGTYVGFRSGQSDAMYLPGYLLVPVVVAALVALPAAVLVLRRKAPSGRRHSALLTALGSVTVLICGSLWIFQVPMLIRASSTRVQMDDLAEQYWHDRDGAHLYKEVPVDGGKLGDFAVTTVETDQCGFSTLEGHGLYFRTSDWSGLIWCSTGHPRSETIHDEVRHLSGPWWMSYYVHG